MVIPRSWLAAAFGLVGFAITLFIACSGDDAEAMRMVNTAAWLAADGGSSSGSSSSSSSGGGGGGFDASGCFGVYCCSDAAASGGAWRPNANGSRACNDWQAMWEAGARTAADLPPEWMANDELIANPFTQGEFRQNLGCATSANVQFQSDGLHLIATPYDGGFCRCTYDAGSVAGFTNPVVPAGYAGEIVQLYGQKNDVPSTYSLVVNSPDGTNTCSGGTGNCGDPTYFAVQAFGDAGATIPNFPGADTWNWCWPGGALYGTIGCTGHAPYAVEIDYPDDYKGAFNHSNYNNTAQIHGLTYTHRGSFQTLSETTTPSTSTRMFGGGLNDTIASDIHGTDIWLWEFNENRTAGNRAVRTDVIIAREGRCELGDGGACF